MSRVNTFVAVLFFVFILPGCRQNTTAPASPPVVRLKVPGFVKDSAFVFVKTQVEFGPRAPGSNGHKLCGDWIAAKARSYGARVIEQPFKAQTFSGIKFDARNIIASFNESIKPRILLAAHWDTRFIADQDSIISKKNTPVMGADDGASGVGVLLEIARQLQAHPIPNLGVDLIFFDAEDQGGDSESEDASETWCLGAQYWSRNKHVQGYQAKYGILLDMVGARSPRFTKESTSMRYAPAIMDKVWALAQNIGYGNYFVNENTPGITDDHYFVNYISRIPMIDIINRPANDRFVGHWHTTHDQLSNIDPDALRATGQVVLAVLYREANGDF